MNATCSAQLDLSLTTPQRFKGGMLDFFHTIEKLKVRNYYSHSTPLYRPNVHSRTHARRRRFPKKNQKKTHFINPTPNSPARETNGLGKPQGRETRIDRGPHVQVRLRSRPSPFASESELTTSSLLRTQHLNKQDGNDGDGPPRDGRAASQYC